MSHRYRNCVNFTGRRRSYLVHRDRCVLPVQDLSFAHSLTPRGARTHTSDGCFGCEVDLTGRYQP
jgi:hypothetical protein